MKIYIPTFGRVAAQRTLASLPRVVQKDVTLVAYKEEHKELQDRYGLPVLVCPPKVRGIAPKRQFIVEHHHRHESDARLVMLDDDLTFSTRRLDDPTRFQPATDKDLVAMFKAVNTALKEYAHVSVIGREGGNRVTEDAVATRMTRFLAYDSDVFIREKIKFTHAKYMSDFDVTLQLLRKGFPNLVLASWCQNQGSSNAPGGCSATRTIESLRLAAESLAARHAPFVKLVTKQTKTAWGGGERTDVQVSWKKAFLSSGGHL